MDQQKIGDFIMRLRKKNKLTQSELASLIFVARETVGKWERGINYPDAHSLVLLSKLFNVSINEIIAGEYLNEDNKNKINTYALDILSKDKKNKKDYTNIISTIAILLIIFFFAYFICNFNSMRIYFVSGENEEYTLSRSLIVISNQKSYIQIGNIKNKHTNENITSEQGYKVSVYYNLNEVDYLLFSSSGADTIYTNLNKDENIDAKTLISVMDSLYLMIETEESISRIDLNVRLDYINNNLFDINIVEEKSDNTEIIESQSLEEHYNNKQRISSYAEIINPIEYETANKKLTLSATCYESENVCQVLFTTIWKELPKVKSYDCMGVRFYDTILLDDNYTSIANEDIEPIYNYNSYRGLGSIFDLSSNEISIITQTFNVEYRGSIYATYQHACKKVSLQEAKKFNFSTNGYGDVFTWESKRTEEAYDDMPGIKLILKEEK